MNCPQCQSQHLIKRGFDQLADGSRLQRYQRKAYHHSFNERSGMPMARLQIPQSVVSDAMSAHRQGMGIRATGRTFGKPHRNIIP